MSLLQGPTLAMNDVVTFSALVDRCPTFGEIVAKPYIYRGSLHVLERPVVSYPSYLPIPHVICDRRQRSADLIPNHIDTDFSNSTIFRDVGLNEPKEFRFIFEHTLDITQCERVGKADGVTAIAPLPFGDVVCAYVTQ